MGIFQFGVAVVDALKLIFSPFKKDVAYLTQLKTNAKALGEEMKDLKDMETDTKEAVDLEERQRRVKPTRQVESWMEDVDKLSVEEEKFQESFRQRTPWFRGCSCFSNHKLGKTAHELLERAQRLKTKRESIGQQLVAELPPDPVEKQEIGRYVVGQDEALATISRFLEDDEVGVVGIYGMGGVGKTTLMKKINNELDGKGAGFDVVIWATVSSDWNPLAIQSAISKRLGLPQSLDEESSRNYLHRTLSRKKFLLLLDDVWETLDLANLGIPLPNGQNKCKIVFTTRSVEVCSAMDCQRRVKVRALDFNESWELFCAKVQNKNLVEHPAFEPLAKAVVAKCKGLPLALITVGRAMAHKTSLRDWEDAKQELEEAAREFPGIKDHVLLSLRFSFKNLETDAMRYCLLYCSLYPEDADISVEEVIDQLTGEGFLDSDNQTCGCDIVKAYRRGRGIIRRLQDACLLEEGSPGDDEEYVKMHDLVREMAFCLNSGGFDKINSGESDKTDRFVVCSPKESMLLAKPLKLDEYSKVKWISMINCLYVSSVLVEYPFIGSPCCPDLVTWLYQYHGSCLSLPIEIPENFFKFMPALRVLNLLNRPVSNLPQSISSLHSLRCLNVSGSYITSIPEEVGNLKNLRILELHGMSALETIPRMAISSLSLLQKLTLMHCNKFKWTSGSNLCSSVEDNPQISMADLDDLPKLQDLWIDIKTMDDYDQLCTSMLLPKVTRRLNFSEGHLSDEKWEWMIDGKKLFYNLEWVELRQLNRLSRINVVGTLPNLTNLIIHNCCGLRNLHFLLKLPRLKVLDLSDMNQIECIMEPEEEITVVGNANHHNRCYFPCLTTMKLSCMPRLRSISRHLVLLPSLEFLLVTFCPLLKKLLFSSENIRIIKGYRDWFDGLDGEDKARFDRYFHPLES